MMMMVLKSIKTI